MNPTFIGAIYIFAGNFAIANFALCQGQTIEISQNPTLFNLLGTTYGGNGASTFALPDLRGRVTINQGTGNGLSTYVIGQLGGSENVTLNSTQMPSHTHLINASSANGTSPTPTNASYLAATALNGAGQKFYSTSTPNATLANSVIGNAGGSIPFSIVQPVLAMNYVIALYGVYPSQN